jgi:hypothetical protein
MIHNDEKEPITVMLDYRPERRVRPFYCVRCGKCVCEITGEPRAIIPGYPTQGELDEMGATHVARCGGTIYLGHDRRLRCTARYIFN